MFDKPDSKHIFDEIERGMRLFGKLKPKKEFTLQEFMLSGYVIQRISDKAILGDPKGISYYYLFTTKEEAEHYKNTIFTVKGDYEVILIGCIKIPESE
jgi:hypothetical protein